MSKLTVIDHPLVQHKLSHLRDKRTGSKEFRELVEEIAMLLTYEATRDLPLEETMVETPVAMAKTYTLAGRKLGIVPILRAGLGMVDGVLKGLGEQLATFYYSLADSIFRIAAIWLLLPCYGMAAFLGIMITSNLFTFTLNLTRMLHCIQKPPPKKEAA